MKNIHKQIILSLKNPIIHNHVVYGQEVLPGLAYIDMIYQIFREHGYSYTNLQLHNLSIYSPLSVGKASAIVLAIQCVENREGCWLITIEGQEKQNGVVAQSKKLYVKAEMHWRETELFEEILDVSQIKQDAKEVVDLNQLYRQCRQQELVHTGFIKAEGQIYEADAGILIDIVLGQDALPHAEHFLFHPTLIDGSGVGSGRLLSSLLSADQTLYLPLFYESFCASELLQTQCFTRIQRSSVRLEKELIYVTLEFFNASGQKVAELKNFTSKLVRGAELINPERKARALFTHEQKPFGASLSHVHANNGSLPSENVLTFDVIEDFLRQLLATWLDRSLEQIDTQVGYYQMGLDSQRLLAVVDAIGTRIGASLSPTLLFEYTTIAELSNFLAENYAEHFQFAHSEEKKSIKATPPDREVPSIPDAVERMASGNQNTALSTSSAPSVHEDIAIIGMAGRYPQARTLQEFWNNLQAGKDCITEIPQERWDWHQFDGLTSPSGKQMSHWGGFLDDPACFDPQFFRISPREAEIMDPQERLFLETCWETIEDAGYTPKTLVSARGHYKRSMVGVFAGVMHKDYTLLGAEAAARGHEFPLSLNYAQIANRVSYHCNFHGPSMAIDTVCSSSLTAVHLALESIRHGECEVALAGGVNLSLHPQKYLTYGAWDMYSSDGRCHSFGQGGDGYVSAEGVGAVLLKPLQQAVQDGDRIYAVIKGSAINHVGAVSGISVPSPIAQAAIIEECLTNAGVEARTISYVEAHGTGTSLGDPIEIQGLVNAFGRSTQEKQFCALGSVKSNIGHAESAAGISGLSKVVLQLYHQTLVPSLHAEELNPYLKLEQSPFYIQQESVAWRQPVLIEDGHEVHYPRRAGISSFGATGSNAHLILEEYHLVRVHDRVSQVLGAEGAPMLVPLSARNKERLYAYAKKMQAILDEGMSLADVAYTLQVGREAMEERVIFLVRDIAELRTKLASFAAGQEEIDECWRGLVKNGKKASAAISADEDAQASVRAWMESGEQNQIAERWTKGLEVDWKQLYGERLPQRISLATYPFEMTRYWVPDSENVPVALGKNTVFSPYIHPMLHQNVSDIVGLRFVSVFSGQEFFLTDHVIRGQKVLPGVAYLEMVRVAVEKSVQEQVQASIQLKNISWMRPFVITDQSTAMYIRLTVEDTGEIAFEMYSESDDAQQEPMIYVQGSAVLSPPGEAPTLDIQALKARCQQRVFASAQCYDTYKKVGIAYGAAHQGIAQLYIGEEQALARLSLPASVAQTQSQYVLHPSMLDAALQAALGMRPDLDAIGSESKLGLPFALQHVEIFGSCTPSMWAYVRYSPGSTAEDYIPKLDFDVCDDQGRICVKMQGFSSRVLEDNVHLNATPSNIATLMLEPIWEEKTFIETSKESHDVKQKVLICEFDTLEEKKLNAYCDCSVLMAKPAAIDERFEVYAVQAFEEVQRLLKAKFKGHALLQIVIPAQKKPQLLRGLTGLLKTAQLENPSLSGQLIEVDADIDTAGMIEKLQENRLSPDDGHVCYEGGKRYVAAWKEFEVARSSANIPWKDKGIYLITGGTGGLGQIFVREIAQQVRNATFILTGRSPLTTEKQAQLRELEISGARVIYKQTDITDKAAVRALMDTIQKEYGTLNGIIHSAGVIKDNFILKKNAEEVREVLAPKVAGLVNLDEASQDILLDCFIIFSSNAGTVGSSGQADYALANAFMNAYGDYRNQQMKSKRCHGKTLTMNWPLWKDGGMHVDEETEKVLTRATGMVPMASETGIQALYRAWNADRARVMVVEGAVTQVRAFLLRTHNVQVVHPSIQSGVRENASSQQKGVQAHVTWQGNEVDLHEKAENHLKHVLASTIKLPVERIDASAPLEQYGIDSIMIMHLNNQLEKIFGSLSKTLFFEYQDIRSLTGYFLESHHARLLEVLGIRENNVTPHEEPAASTAGVAGLQTIVNGYKPFGVSPLFVTSREETQRPEVHSEAEIAIIGVAGKYPQADNLQEFWENLRDGQDCITEIPKERWDHSLYFDKDKDKPGKTYSKWGGFISDVDKFDPQFFHISPREAELIDPQERLFLQCVYETLEDAGYTRENITLRNESDQDGNVGVYVGVMYEEYQLYGVQEQVLGRPLVLAGNPSSIANRVSYFFNFHGPSMALDTMCSSSLTAIHLACQSLLHGECEVAIAGGVNVSIHPNKYLMLGQGKFVSSKGRCESFGQGGDGYVPGEGVGAILLKPLAKAIAAGDQIYGIVKGTAVNHGGKTNGYSVPNPNAQVSVIKQALKTARVDPRTVSYIEAHGTGTSLGDPIEISSLARVFDERSADEQFCAIGSAKSNIGHCESAAGIAGVTKVLLQLKYGQLVPSLHSQVLNPNIDFMKTPFRVQQELEEWKRPLVEVDGKKSEYPRIAGVSSFGAGGVNAHIVIEEYRPSARVNNADDALLSTRQDPVIILLSARNEEKLQRRVERLLQAIREGKYAEIDLVRIAYTLQVGREAMDERLALLVDNIAELEEKLQGFAAGKEGIIGLYWGQVKRFRDTLGAFVADEDMGKIVDAWIVKRKYNKLADLWVKGLNIDWNKLYRKPYPRRMSLPAYPFARERYWIGEGKSTFISQKIGEKEVLSVKDAIVPVNKSKEEVTVTLPLIDKSISITKPLPTSEIKHKPNNVVLRSVQEEQHFSNRFAGEQREADLVPLPESPAQPLVALDVLHETLTMSLSEVLFMDQNDIDPNAMFVDLGLDSVTGLEWIKTINKRYGSSIAATKIYDYPTIRDFADYLQLELKQHSKGSNGHKEEKRKTDQPLRAVFEFSTQLILDKPNSVALRPLQEGQRYAHEAVKEQKESKASPLLTPLVASTAHPLITRDVLHEELMASLAEVLYINQDDVDPDVKFVDLGLDSVTGLEWIKAINKRYGAPIAVTKVYDYPTIRDFADYLYLELSKRSSGSSGQSNEHNRFQNSQDTQLQPPKQAVKEERAAITSVPQDKDVIAIVGMSGRYAGAQNLEQYWDNLAHARNSVREIPASRWDMQQYYDPRLNQKGKIYCKSMGMLDDIEYFDPLFFNLSPAEAEVMDPQHRIFLQEGYKSFEDAGYGSRSLNNKKCAVYLGIMNNEYSAMLHQNQVDASATGNSFAIAAARIPYYFNLKGPAISLDTACSSSLVGIHLACQALLQQEIDMALVGGVSLYLTPDSYISMCTAGMLSPDGQCKTFDNNANGFVPGEGVGAVVLKRLSDAEADKDHIYGVIIGSGINQDGRTNGITAPSVNSQMDLEREVYKKYQIDPASINYVEMHGTGTKQGDPIELEALSTVFKEKTSAINYCAIGSVKSNIGHTAAAAGIASIQKVLLCMKNEKLVPTLHFEKHNEHFDFNSSPFYVNTELKQWDALNRAPRRAGISSFGYSGTNAHIVLEEYLPDKSNTEAISTLNEDGKLEMFVLSAKKKAQLKTSVQVMKSFVEANHDLNLTDVAYTLQIGRDAMDYRMAVVASSQAMLLKALADYLDDKPSSEVFSAQVKESKEEIKVFASDEDAKLLLQTWIKKKTFARLAALWVKGLVIDWNMLHDEPLPRRISLPTYAFAREYYWFPQSSVSSDNCVKRVAARVNVEEAQEHSRHFLTKQWALSPVVPGPSSTGNVLILMRSEVSGLATEVAHFFAHPLVVDIQQLAEPATISNWTHFDGIVDLIGCGQNSEATIDGIAWLQALVEYGGKDGLVLLGVTRGLEAFQATSINLAGACRAGLYRMLHSEYRHLSSRHLDVEALDDETMLARQIADEFYAKSEDVEVCYRAGQRYRAFLDEYSAANLVAPQVRERFLADQVLVITGGTRGLGALCARHFVAQYGVKRLVLIGREPLPARTQWEQLRQSTSSVADKIALVQELEAQGVQVVVRSLRLADAAAVHVSLRDIRETMGPIGGVIHCAGLTDAKSPAFIRKDSVTMQNVLEPKVAGLVTLLRELHGEPLRFCVLFSSVAGIIPALSVGQSDYALANAAMDYIAEANRERYPILSIQWPNWKETGMGEVNTSAYRESGLLNLTNADGLSLLDQLLTSGGTSVILPALVDETRWTPGRFLQRSRLQMPAFEHSQAGPLRANVEKVTFEISPVASALTLREQTQAWLVALFAAELKVAPTQLEIDEPIQEYGVDSILLVQVLQRLNERLNVTLDPSILYEYPTIEGLSIWLVEAYTPTLTQLFGAHALERPVEFGHGEVPDLPSLDKPMVTLQEVIKETMHHPLSPEQDIAVVGLSCRFPGAESLDAYWDLLVEGRSALRPVPHERWGGPTAYVAGVIANSTWCDPGFFHLPEEDARAMDPQALIALEECLKLWYHAGYRHEEMKGKDIGIYLGGRSQHLPVDAYLRQAKNPIVAVGQNYLAANLSHFFDVRGPSVVLDTACSSALVGLNMAIQALRAGDIEAAVVGGVSLLETDATHQLFQQRGLLSTGSAFHVFDERANGVVLGEGVGMVLVKTVKQALQDGDTIYAVIKAVAINNDGRTAGPATPNLQAQKDVMQAALAKSGRRAEEISHLEANGSGSMVTDLIELKAIQAVYRSCTEHPLSVGSIKPNIGHPLCAEGIASLIKVVLMEQHRRLVPFMSGEQALIHFDREAANLSFIRRQTEWAGRVPVAAINCFADGGTNAHIIVEGWEEVAERVVRRHPLMSPHLQKRSLALWDLDIHMKNADIPSINGAKKMFWKTFA